MVKGEKNEQRSILFYTSQPHFHSCQVQFFSVLNKFNLNFDAFAMSELFSVYIGL